jgi:hypothetical protein
MAVVLRQQRRMHEAHRVSTRDAHFVGLMHFVVRRTAVERAGGEVKQTAGGMGQQRRVHEARRMSIWDAHSVGLVHFGVLGMAVETVGGAAAVRYR